MLWSLMNDEEKIMRQTLWIKVRKKKQVDMRRLSEATAGGTEGPSAGAQRGRSISTCYLRCYSPLYKHLTKLLGRESTKSS